MLQANTDDKLSKTVLDFLTHGAYPESEDVAATKFPASAAPAALQQISRAREEAEVFTCCPFECIDPKLTRLFLERNMRT